MSTIRQALVDKLADVLGVIPPKPKREPRLYVIVRADIVPPGCEPGRPYPGYQAAQAAHAATYLAAESKLALYQHPTITILNVPNEEILHKTAAMHQYVPGDPELWMFHEPDLGNEATAFACYSEGREFAGLPLMK
jgi:hypothetical protein